MRTECPQSVAEAISWGWIWLNVTCVCRHRAEIRLESFTIAQANMPFGKVLRRLRCTKCKSRDVSLHLGCWSASSMADRRAVEIDGDRLVVPTR